MGTIAITGAASGIGAAAAARLTAGGHHVIGVDLHDTEVVADLAMPAGRRRAVDAVRVACGDVLDGLVTCAGLGGLPSRAGWRLVEVNYFGTTEVIDGLRPALATGSSPSVIAIASNSTTIQPGVPDDLVHACLSGDRNRARELADGAGSVASYPATKMAVCRWVRRHAPTAEWIGSGIRLNAIAPGMIDTALVQEQRADDEMAPLLDMLPIPLGRPGRPEEVAAVLEFLLGPESTLFCGSIVLADGGTEALLRPDDWPAPWNLGADGSAAVFGTNQP